MRHITDHLRIAGVVMAVLVLALAGAGYGQVVEVDKLKAADAERDALFGNSISMDGDRLVVGAYFDDDKGTDSGAVYVFTWDGTSWTQQTKLSAADVGPGDQFGTIVSLDGDRLLVGAQHSGGSYVGAAYVFHWDGADWVEKAKLTASDAAPINFFGSTGSIDGDRLVVGAYGNYFSRGAVYEFTWDGTSWTQQTKLIAPDGVGGDHFSAVSLDGDRLLVGAHSDDAERGAAYVFEWDGSSWGPGTKLTASDRAAGDGFGYTLSLDGDRLVVAAGADDNANGVNAGAAYVFTWNGTSWVEQAKLTASDGAAGDRFGSVSLDGDRLVVGAGYDDDNGPDSGSAYVFTWNGTSWTELTKLTASDGETKDYFGLSVAQSAKGLAIGASYDDETPPGDSVTYGSGAVYMYTFNEPPTADAGEDQAVACAGLEGTEVTLDGTGSSDPDGDELNYSWSLDGEEIATGVNPTVTLPDAEDHVHPISFSIALTVDDGWGGDDSDAVTVTIVDTTPPEVEAALIAMRRHGDDGDDNDGDDDDNDGDDDDDDGDDDGGAGKYQVAVSASDICDPDPILTSVIAQPVTQADAYKVRYKRHKKKNEIKIKIDKDIRVTLKGPDEASLLSLLDNAIALGGFPVVDAQVLKLVSKPLTPNRVGDDDDDDDGKGKRSKKPVVKDDDDDEKDKKGKKDDDDDEKDKKGKKDDDDDEKDKKGKKGKNTDPRRGSYKYTFALDLDLTSAEGPGVRLVAFATDASGNASVPVEVYPPRRRRSKPALAVAEGAYTFGLGQNYPNPSNPSTTIRYTLSEGSDVRLVVYDVLGQAVRELVGRFQAAGVYQVVWDGRDAVGRMVSSGVYVYRLQAGEQVAIRKMVFVK